DLVIGAQGSDAGGFSSGRTYVVYGTDDTTTIALSNIAAGIGGFAIEGEQANDVSGWSVFGGTDISGDGLADVLIGAFDAPAAMGAGRGYALFGGDFRGLVTIAGTAGDDMLMGSAANESIVAGLGDDTLHSGGGFDVLYAGPGDDTIALPSSQLFRIDG